MEKIDDTNKDKIDVEDELKQLESMLYGGKKKKGDQVKDDYKFWDTQPVPKIKETVDKTGPLESKTLEEVRQNPYTLPKGYSWRDLDINDKKDLEEVRNF